MFDESSLLIKQSTLIGADRARDITINIVLPFVLAYANETEDSQLKNTVLQVYHQHPKLASNKIIKNIANLLFENEKVVNTALKQQGLLHLNKTYCKNRPRI